MSRDLPPQLWRTFAAAAPTETHWAPATCAEVDCPAYRHGFALTLDLTDPRGQADLALIRARYRLGQYALDGPATATLVVFEAGTPCLASHTHRRPLERPPLYVVRDGDHGRPLAGTAVRLPDFDAWAGEYMDQRERTLASKG